MASKNYYAVKVGEKTGIFKTWKECSKYVSGYPNAKFKGFTTLEEAEKYIGKSGDKKNNKAPREGKKKYKFDSQKFNSETKNYYVVRCGREIGVFLTWEECEEQVKGYSGAEYKKVVGKNKAIEYLAEGNIEIVEENLNKEKALRGNIKDKYGYNVDPIKSKAKVKVSKTYIEPKEIINDFEYIAFVDGSYDKINKIYGSGVIVLKDDLVNCKTLYDAGYDKWDQWNIVGELESVKLAILKAKEVGANNVAIYHDLKNISLWACGEWKAKNIYTQEYVRFIEEHSQKLNIYFIKVKAHSEESKFNDLADEAAKTAISRYLFEIK